MATATLASMLKNRWVFMEGSRKVEIFHFQPETGDAPEGGTSTVASSLAHAEEVSMPLSGPLAATDQNALLTSASDEGSQLIRLLSMNDDSGSQGKPFVIIVTGR